MNSVKDNLQRIRATIPDEVKLVCVSKFQSANAILEAYAAGERVFGESRVQELQQKRESLPQDIQWHFIGHLQTNKVRSVVPFVDLIQSVDTEKLLMEINSQSAKIQRVSNVLLQVHIAQEETKFGFSAAELTAFLFSRRWDTLQNVRICGLMGMASFTENEAQIRAEMRFLQQLFDRVKSDFFADSEYFTEISMGMSDDYQIAIETGTTLVRIGSRIFGTREH